MDKMKSKVRKVMKEYKEGKLKSGSGEKVKSRKQAVAIAMSESGQKKKGYQWKRKVYTITLMSVRKKELVDLKKIQPYLQKLIRIC